MTAFTQQGRVISLATPLGEDVLLLERFDSREAVSRLFRYDLAALSRRDDIGADELLGTNVTITLRCSDGSIRYVNGLVAEFSIGGLTARGLRKYRLAVVPWPWLLTRTTDCRIFQDVTVPDILEELFSDAGFKEYQLQLRANHPRRTYCVQYNETDWDFACRLMEDEGIHYWFRHENGLHTLVLGDGNASFVRCPEAQARHASTTATEDRLLSWERSHSFRSGLVAQDDYDFTNPRGDLSVSARTVVDIPGMPSWELFEYPGGHAKKAEGDERARLRIEAEELQTLTVTARNGYRSFHPGGRFVLEDHEVVAETGREYLIVSMETSVAGPSYLESAKREETFESTLVCHPFERTFRPPRHTPRPSVKGVQTAAVVGPAGEEIHTDSYGRIKVRFHWDRRSEGDERSSCWVRVAQSLAGRNWGAMAVPRVGMEVVVDFVDGDPDRPLVVGCLVNADNMPPYALPGERTKIAMKSRSSPGGGGFNELRLEDKKGKEQIFLHGQKDFDLRVRQVLREYVGASRHSIVGGDRLELTGGDLHTTTTGDSNHKVEGAVSLDVQMDRQEKIGLNWMHKSGAAVKIEAGMSVTLQVGGNFISITPAGVIISGTLVMINSGGAAPGGSASPAAAKKPAAADDGSPGGPGDQRRGKTLPKPSHSRAAGTQARTLQAAAQARAAFVEQCAEAKGP
ncbi:MAG: type VI secretion system tip protein VgrG [Alphaproteobacteria bacterium]|nr:type VI secretion system tip protein VgrG [Alphaproteobacteria bacterium]